MLLTESPDKSGQKLPEFVQNMVFDILSELKIATITNESYLRGKLDGIKELSSIIDPSSLELIEKMIKGN